MKRFLFVMSDTGGGHRASARAVGDEMVRLYGDAVTVDVADIFVELGRWPFSRFPSWYPSLVGLDSVPWGVGYHLTDHARLVQTASYLAYPYTRMALRRFIRRHPADVIVSFHGVPNYALFLALQRMGLHVPMVTVVLDMVSVHAGWFTPGSLAYFVPTEQARQRALRWGLPPERVEVMGSMPVRRAFVESCHLPQQQARAQLGLPADRPIVLMVGGGEGMGPLEAVVRAIGKTRPAAYLVAVAGRNQALCERLQALELPVPLRVEGFVPNMDVWMRAVDLLVTKAGPNTLSEAFVSGLPVVIYAALHGQEMGNVDYVVENGAGVWAPQPERAAAAVHGLLNDPQRRQLMAERARSLGNPQAAEMLARRLWEMRPAEGWWANNLSPTRRLLQYIARRQGEILGGESSPGLPLPGAERLGKKEQ